MYMYESVSYSAMVINTLPQCTTSLWGLLVEVKSPALGNNIMFVNAKLTLSIILTTVLAMFGAWQQLMSLMTHWIVSSNADWQKTL